MTYCRTSTCTCRTSTVTLPRLQRFPQPKLLPCSCSCRRATPSPRLLPLASPALCSLGLINSCSNKPPKSRSCSSRCTAACRSAVQRLTPAFCPFPSQVKMLHARRPSPERAVAAQPPPPPAPAAAPLQLRTAADIAAHEQVLALQAALASAHARNDVLQASTPPPPHPPVDSPRVTPSPPPPPCSGRCMRRRRGRGGCSWSATSCPGASGAGGSVCGSVGRGISRASSDALNQIEQERAQCVMHQRRVDEVTMR